MKRIKLLFITLVLVAICGAFAIRQTSTNSLVRKYRIIFYSTFRMYVEDITNLNSGMEYDCIAGSSNVCTFTYSSMPFYDPELGLYYFTIPVLINAVDHETGDFYDLRY